MPPDLPIDTPEAGMDETVSGSLDAAALREQLEVAHARREAAESARVHLDSIIRHLPVGIVVAEAPSGRMITYNPAAERIFDYPLPLAEQVEEYSEIYRGYHADGRVYAPDEWPLARAIRTGEVVTGEEVEMERPDGERRVLRLSAAPIRDAEGRIVAGVVSLFDATEEKRRAQRLHFLGQVSDILSTSLDYEETVGRIAELCSRVLADSCAVYVQEEDGHVRGLGFAAALPDDREALGRLFRVVPPIAAADHPLAGVLRTGEPLVVEEVTDELVRALGGGAEGAALVGRLDLGALLVVPLAAAGRTLGAIALGRRRGTPPFGAEDRLLAQELAARAAHAVDNARLYREARRAARVQEETIGVVSHDLRNALNAALTNADLLLELTPTLVPGSRERRRMEAVRRSLDLMHRLVQDLLEVDRFERGRLSIEPSRLLPASLVEELNGVLGPLAREAGLHWEVEIAGEVPAVAADGARLLQVFANLVGNAVKATPPGGRISIRAEGAGDGVRFEVSDTGGGIDAEHLPRVFDRFFQVPGRGRTGSGLGLAIARGIVEAHGGRMWVRSERGVGSTFSFSLPRAP